MDPKLVLETIGVYAVVGFGIALGWHSFAIIVNTLSMGCEYVAKTLRGDTITDDERP